MRRYALLVIGLVSLSLVGAAAQTAIVTGDRGTPLRPLAGEDDVGVSNATLRDQPELRVLRVVVEPGGQRVLHTHDDVNFHFFMPITDTMTLDLDGGQTVDVEPWHPYYLDAGTLHGFRNLNADAVDIVEVFVR